MNWEEVYQKGGAFWNNGKPSPPIVQYLQRNAVRGRTFVPGCGHGHEVALAAEHGMDAIVLDIAPTGIEHVQEGQASGRLRRAKSREENA
jgi:hypothetical protein